MLNTFRTFSHGIGAKILLAVLVVAFAIWGVGDFTGKPKQNAAVATVGSASIHYKDFQQALRAEIEQMRQMMGDRYSPELLQAMQPERRVIQSMTQKLLLKQEAKELGIVPSDADVAQYIRTIPAFQNSKGKLDKDAFAAFLRNRNLSEKAYVDSVRDEIASRLLIETIASGAVKPFDIAAETLAAAKEEQRMAMIYAFTDAVVGTIAPPAKEALDAFYEQHKSEFSIPEMRRASYVVLRPEDAHAEVKITEDDLLASYKERIDEFKRPERRLVDQLLYTGEADAKAASTLLKAGKSFEQVAATTAITNKGNLSLGKIERSGVLEAAADAVFTAEAGQVTAPIQSPFGWHIFRVKEVVASGVAPLADVRATIERDLKQRLLDEQQNRLSNTLEDALAGGATLAEAARELGLKVQQAGPFTAQGKTPDGNEAKLPQLDNFLKTVFSTEEKTASLLTRSAGGAFYVVFVDAVIHERAQPLDDVRGAVVAAWQKQERADAFNKMAQDIAAKMSDKNTRSALIAKHGLKLVYSGAIKRSTDKVGGMALPATLVEDIFSRAPGDSTPASASGNQYMVAVAGDRVKDAAPGKDALAAARTAMQNDMQNERLMEYLLYLESKHPVSVNEAMLEPSKE